MRKKKEIQDCLDIAWLRHEAGKAASRYFQDVFAWEILRTKIQGTMKHCVNGRDEIK